MGVVASAASIELHHKPEKIVLSARQEPFKRTPARSSEESLKQVEINRLKKRITLLESLQKLVHHKTYGSRVFPYENKIYFLREQLKSFETN